MKVRLLKALCFGGARTEAGTELDLPDHMAREAVHRGVAERVNPAPVPSGPMTTESVAELVEGKPSRRSKKDAG